MTTPLVSCCFRSTDLERKPGCRSGSRSSWERQLSLVQTHTEPCAPLLTSQSCCSHLVELPLEEMCWPKAHASPTPRSSPSHRYMSHSVCSHCDVPGAPHLLENPPLCNPAFFSVMENIKHVMRKIYNYKTVTNFLVLVKHFWTWKRSRYTYWKIHQNKCIFLFLCWVKTNCWYVRIGI